MAKPKKHYPKPQRSAKNASSPAAQGHARPRTSGAKSTSTGSYIEGKNAVIEALRAEIPLKEIMIASGVKNDPGFEEITRRAKEAGSSISIVDRRELDRLSDHGSHQGVIATIAPFEYTTLADVLAKVHGQESALIIALDHITDPGNLGAVTRSAEVVGAAGIVVPSRRSASVTAGAYKASAGALAHILLAQETNLVRALEECKKEGFWIVGATEDAEQAIWDAPLEGRIVIVMGSEGEGLSRLTQETCDLLVKLPQQGNVGSLNVAQATTAVAYEWLRKTMTAGSFSGQDKHS